MVESTTGRFLLSLQKRVDELTERLNKPIKDYAYWDGYNDVMLECLTRLEKLLGVEK